MKKSPVYPKYEAGGRGGDAFDPYVDFSQVIVSNFFFLSFVNGGED